MIFKLLSNSNFATILDKGIGQNEIPGACTQPLGQLTLNLRMKNINRKKNTEVTCRAEGAVGVTGSEDELLSGLPIGLRELLMFDIRSVGVTG